MAFSNTLRNAMQDQAFGRSSFLNPTTLYIGLSRVEPGFDAATNSEHSGDAYARVAVINSADNWDASAAGVKRNTNAITFPEASGSWGLVSHATLWTATTSDGAAAYWGSAPLGTSKNIISGDTPNIPANSLSFTINSSA